jgi:hypothetical protein
MIELHVALRNINDELKELADVIQAYYQTRSEKALSNMKAARANVTAKPNGSKNPTGGAYLAGKRDAQAEADEETGLDKLKKEIVRWLKSAPTDMPEEIAPLIPAPLGMVKRIRTQLVDAGHLRQLEVPKEEVKTLPSLTKT